MQEYINLVEEGLPYIRLYRYGDIYSERFERWLKTTTIKSGSYLQVSNNGKPIAVSVTLLIRKYFDNYLNKTDVSQYKRICENGFASHYYATVIGRIWDSNFYKFTKEFPNRDGYPRISMTINGDRGLWLVHRLIAKAFVPNPNNLPEVNHIDGVKTNNYADNLEWSDRVWNMRHARLTGLRTQALTEAEVHEACKMLNDGYRVGHIARHFNTHKSNIQNLRRGTYKYITEQYNIELNDKCK